MVSFVKFCCKVRDKQDLVMIKVIFCFNKRYLFQWNGGDENLTSVDSDESGWRRNRDNNSRLQIILQKIFIGKLEQRNCIVDAIGHGIKQQLNYSLFVDKNDPIERDNCKNTVP